MPDAVSKSSLNTFHILHKGCVPYLDAFALQESLHAARSNGEIPDTLILLEHSPVFTTGRQDVASDWLVSHDEIRARGIDIVSTNRGGRITYHGPGQLVGYFICDLQARQIGIADFVYWIESCLIEILSRYGITAHRDPAHPGVWVGRDKIAAIGLNVRRFVTLHGFALNVTTDMTPYSYCVPCGIIDRGVTRLETLRPERAWTVQDVAQNVAAYFSSMAAKVGSEPSVSSTNIGHSSL
jgi:lipoyl(octanoyl) transferase